MKRNKYDFVNVTHITKYFSQDIFKKYEAGSNTA